MSNDEQKNERQKFSAVFLKHLKKLKLRTGFKQYEDIKHDTALVKELLTELVDTVSQFDVTPDDLDYVLGKAVLVQDDKFIGINSRFVYNHVYKWTVTNTKKGSAYQESPRIIHSEEDKVKIDAHIAKWKELVKQVGNPVPKAEATLNRDMARRAKLYENDQPAPVLPMDKDRKRRQYELLVPDYSTEYLKKELATADPILLEVIQAELETREKQR